MDILRQLLAVLLALLVANPVCCCAFAASDRNASEAPATCCHAPAELPDSSPAPHPGPERDCPCAKDAPALLEGKAESLGQQLPFPVVPPVLVRSGLPFPEPVTLVPAGRASSQAPPPSQCRLYCRYLL